MKTKNKILAVVEIAIVLCSMLLVALPVIAADQTTQEVSASEITTASKDDFVLGVYGNANEDDTIDMRDLTYVKLIFFGKKPETELADAKYDGKINPLDFIQIKLIIVGKEKEITVVDANEDDVTVSMPLERIVVINSDAAEAIRTLGAKDRIVGVTDIMTEMPEFFPALSQKPSVGLFYEPDIEKILELEPDAVFTARHYPSPEYFENKLPPTIDVVRLDFYKPHNMAEEMGILGYIVDKRQEAGEFIDWHEGYMNTIYERVEGLSEDEKPKIYNEAGTYGTYTESSGWTMPGGINIAADLSEAEFVYVDPEWVVEQNPDIIIKQVYGVTGYTIDDTSEVEAARDEVMSRPELAGVTAVKEGKVYCIDMDTSCSVFGHAYCAKWVQPELFEDLDPQEIHEEYLERFQGIPYQGIHVYPPLE